MSKLERKYLAHYIDTATQGDPSYERLGADLEEFSVEMSAQVDKKKNILGENTVMISGYEKTGAVEQYYANSGTGLFDRLQEIIDKEMVLEELKTHVVTVKLWEEADAKGYCATREEAYIEVSSYGGDTTGYQIPFTLHLTGKRQQGHFDVSTRTFTSAEADSGK
jgi:hypothetical protein